MKKKILLTGDRPTGALHLGHYIGSLAARLKFQEECEPYIMVADAQAVTDNFDNIEKVRNNIVEVVADYLSVGIDPKKSHIFIQSQLPELPELTMYYLNLLTIQRIGHNPTVKAESKSRGYDEGMPAGFYLYPAYQVADITAFKADIVPVGRDQTPMLELTRDLVRRFNELYKTKTLVVPEAVYPTFEGSLPGTDGQKMSKSQNNAIYLSDEDDIIVKKVAKMRSDPNRKSLADPGDPKESIAFTYLDLFDPEPLKVTELKEHYKRGGLPDKLVKERLTDILSAFLTPIRARRKSILQNQEEIFTALRDGTAAARARASHTLAEVKRAMGIDYPHIFPPTIRPR